MNPSFEAIQLRPENAVFCIVFYPDRIYHAQYLNATRSPRYRYYVAEVRNRLDITIMKGMVFLDGVFLCNFLRVEYRASRLVEQARQRERFLRSKVVASIRLLPLDSSKSASATVQMHYDEWIAAYQVEIWQTLEAPPTQHHDIKVANIMGANNEITRVRSFVPALGDLDGLKQLELAFRETDIDEPLGYRISNPGWDNAYRGSYQVPNTQNPSDPQNTMEVDSYLIDFRRGWFFDDVGKIPPVRYENAMMESKSPDFNPNHGQNVIELRWVIQREMGSSVVYFHEVTIPPGCIEGTHQHIGSEELYYIFEGQGVAYMGDGDDPNLNGSGSFPLKSIEIFCVGPRNVRVVPVKPRSVIFTKSGGIHGIRNTGTTPLRFVAFGYSSA
jgi:mannose-6-phosphate isomerase-like protein (cupin superfamily)